MSIAQYLLKHIQAEHLTPEKAPGLYDAVKGIASQHKVPIPKIHLAPQKPHWHPIINALCNKPNAGSLSRMDIILSKPILELFGSADLTKPISQELKGVIAHEMHHCANRGSMMVMTSLPVFALPTIAVAATYIYDRTHAKAKKQGDVSDQNVVSHIDNAAKETKESLPPEEGNSDFFKKILYFGKYFAVAAVGLGAGLLAARYGSRHHEFAADIFGSKSVGKEAMINALRKIHKAAEQSISEHPEAQKFRGIIAKTIRAHPNFAERAANIHARG